VKGSRQGQRSSHPSIHPSIHPSLMSNTFLLIFTKQSLLDPTQYLTFPTRYRRPSRTAQYYTRQPIRTHFSRDPSRGVDAFDHVNTTSHQTKHPLNARHHLYKPRAKDAVVRMDAERRRGRHERESKRRRIKRHIGGFLSASLRSRLSLTWQGGLAMTPSVSTVRPLR
jgi:hypothetical protein